ncbi:MAG TPA: MerR family transcriptional regulator, partial [Micromonosporaceae bacterium]
GAAAGLSPKALRLYAETGLLPPARIDPVTGYRYYAPDQLRRARVIGRLRGLGLPLARIGALADLSAADRATELRGWLRTQRKLLDERAAVVEGVERSDRDAALAASVAVREVAATKVLCRRRTVDSLALPHFVAEAVRDIRAHLSAPGYRLLTFQELVTPDSVGPVEVAITYDGTVEPADDLYIRLVPAHSEAYLPVAAADEDYPEVLRIYDAIEAWIDESGVVATGHPYEIYPGTGTRFDVAYPIEGNLG